MFALVKVARQCQQQRQAMGTHLYSCLGHLGQSDRARNDPIYVATPKVAKARKIVAVACRCHRRYRLKYNTNVNYALKPEAGNTKGGSITVPLTSCLTGLD